MSRITDRMELGFFPLQDHTSDANGRPISQRQSLGGARMVKIPAPDDGEGTLLEVGREKYLGTLGDVHPWLFWQTRGRELRGSGSWSTSFASMVVDADPYYGSTVAQPIRDAEWKNDTRYDRKPVAAPAGLAQYPEGAMVLVVPGTQEDQQADLALWADGRLIAPGVEGPGEMGTLVCDLQPAGTICMADSDEPGVGGRHARLQSLVRVIAVPANQSLGNLGSPGNVLALNYSTSGADGLPGFGAIFAPVVGIGSGGPITGGSSGDPGSGAQDQGESSWDHGQRGRFGGSTLSGGDTFGDPLPGTAGSDEKTPKSFGTFRAKRRGGHGVALMGAMGGWGPIHAGAADDKHALGVDADGHPVNSGHIATGAYFFRDRDQDGPLEFGGGYPQPPGWPLRARTHLSWDRLASHYHQTGPKSGLWRWWTEVPYLAPSSPPTGGRPPNLPDRPDTPPPGGGTPPYPGSPGRPTTPGSPGRRRGPGTGGGPPGNPGRGGPETGGPGRARPPVINPGPPFDRGRPDIDQPVGGKGYPLGGIPGEDPDGGGGTSGGGGGAGGPSTGGPSTGGPGTGGLLCGERDVAILRSFDASGVLNSVAHFGEGWTLSQLMQHGDERWLAWNSEHGGDGGRLGTTWRDARGAIGRWSGRDPWTREPEIVPGLIESVGAAASDLVGAYSIHHPLHETFAALSFRPQLAIARYPNFERNPQLHAGMIVADELRRPHVLTARPWGAQAQGDWSYVEKPHSSRARGGTSNGGLLFCPPRFEAEDYFAIGGAVQDVEDRTSAKATTSYVCAAPGVAFALGKPTSTGGLATGAVVIRQDTAANNRAIVIEQDSNELFRAYDDGADCIVKLGQGGTGAVVIPRGSSGTRPATPAAAMVRARSSSTFDSLEFYDGTNSAWRAVLAGTSAGDLRSQLSLYRIWEDYFYPPANTTSVVSGTGNNYQQDQTSSAWLYTSNLAGLFAVEVGAGGSASDGACRFSTNAGTLYLYDGAEFVFHVGCNGVSNALFRFGLRSDAAASGTADVTNGIYIEINSTTGSNVLACTAAASSRTKESTGYANSNVDQAFKWFKIKFVNGTTGARFYHWDSTSSSWTLDKTISTNLPTAGANRGARWFVQACYNGTTSRKIVIDAFATDPSQVQSSSSGGGVPVLE